MERGPLRIFSGSANPALAKSVAEELGQSLGALDLGRFPDGEVSVQIGESIRGTDCFIIQPTCPPVNENLMELLILVDAFRRGSAERITVVVPYFGYARQDRKARGREPISAKLVANLIAEAGANRVLAVDLHTDQLQGFFDLPVDHLPARQVFAEHFKYLGLKGEDVVVVSPDVGGVHQAKLLADELDAAFGIVVKRRAGPGTNELLEVIGDFKDRRVIIYDDMIQTGGTVLDATDALLRRGAREVHCAVTHPVFSGNACERLAASPLTSLTVCDTIPVPEHKRFDRLTVLTVSSLLADAIERIHLDQSVSASLHTSHYHQPRLFGG